MDVQVLPGGRIQVEGGEPKLTCYDLITGDNWQVEELVSPSFEEDGCTRFGKNLIWYLVSEYFHNYE